MKKIAVAVLSAALLCAFGESFEDELNRVETWINTNYRSGSLAHRSASEKLLNIYKSEKPEEKKIADLRKTFPKAFPAAVMESLIITEPLTWKIHSLSLGYDIQEGFATETKTVDIMKELAQQDTSRQDTDSVGKTKTTSKGGGIKGDVTAGVSLNPLNWLPRASGSISGHYEKNNHSRLESGSVWNEKKQQMFQRNREKILSMINQTAIKNLHLTFTVTFYNLTDSYMTFHMDSASIPVYMGEKSCNDTAKPFRNSRTELKLRPMNPDGQDVVFRMNLDTTTARELVDFMTKNNPEIKLTKGAILIENNKKEDILTKRSALPESSHVVLSGPAGSLFWKIRKFHASGKKVTIGEACDAISQDVKNYKDRLLIKNEKGGLCSVSDVPFGKFRIQGNTGEIAFLEYQERIYSEVSADLLRNPMGHDGFTIHIIDDTSLGKIENPHLIKEIIARFNQIQGENGFKAVFSFQIALYFKENHNNSAYFKWLNLAANLGNDNALYKLSQCYFEGIGTEKDIMKALTCCQKAAERGNSLAQHTLGLFHAKGLGVQKNPIEAVKWWRKAAEQGYAEAQRSLGACYAAGIGVPKDPTEAIKWYQQAAKQGQIDAQFELGKFYMLGDVVSKDLNQAVKWFRKAADQGHAEAQLTMGAYYLSEENGVTVDIHEAVKWFRKAAIRGNAIAQYSIAICHDTGQGVQQDYNEAAKWFQKAADQGHAGAQFSLGMYYHKGQGVQQDYNEAAKWFQKAADQGLADAQCSLALYYCDGIVVKKDYGEAAKWFHKAAEQGFAEAQFSLGLLYYHGGEEKYYNEAAKWFQKAAEQGHVNARFFLGMCYHKGRGAQQDYNEAAKWFQKAAEQGLAAAQYNLGLYYHNGTGVGKNYIEAVKWYRKAADQGDADAQNNLGACYYFGQGVKQDYGEAAKWFQKAAEQGHEKAKKMLKRLNQ